MKKYRIYWTNSDTGISGEMHNIPTDELSGRLEDAWAHAGDGEVILGTEQEEVNEYA